MKNRFLIPILVLMLAFLFGCEKDNNSGSIADVKLQVTFDNSSVNKSSVSRTELSSETPDNYYVALKSVKLLGAEGTEDVYLFNNEKLSDSPVFNFTDEATVHSLLQDAGIPEGDYHTIELEVYYLQMNIGISTARNGIERRNFRIYMSDDAHTEQGLHQPGDMTQINEAGQEIGWLLGEGQEPNMDPVTPRTSAYTYNGDGTSWYDFAGKSGENFGPFGGLDFWASVSQPVYSVKAEFDLSAKEGATIILDLNVNGCWKFEDKDNDGAFGFGDLDPDNPTSWHMELPTISVSVE